jgi:hypothetical protein
MNVWLLSHIQFSTKKLHLNSASIQSRLNTENTLTARILVIKTSNDLASGAQNPLQKHKKYEKNQGNITLPKVNNSSMMYSNDREVNEIIGKNFKRMIINY